MSTFGLDIGTNTIKIAQVEKETDKKFKLISAGLIPTPQPGFQSQQDSDLIPLAQAIKKLHADAKITSKDVVFSLSESQVFSRIIEMPPMSEGELIQAVPWEAEQFVPMPMSDITLDWQIVSRAEKSKVGEKMKILIVAAPTALIKRYTTVLELAGLNVSAIETEMIAAVRALVSSSMPPTIVVNYGAKSCDIAMVIGGQIYFTRSVSTAGEALTRAISSSLALEPSQAEEYKKTYGLEEAQLEGKIKKTIAPVLDIVSGEIKKAILSWKEKDSTPFSGLILCGGTAGLPQISSYLAAQLGIEVQTADPFALLKVDPNFIVKLRPNAPLFAVAIGLAEKEV